MAEEEAARPFDLTEGPLLRARLLRLKDEEHVLLFTMHHIISDGWSMGVFADEVAALYAAFAEGRPSPLAELDIQYADYASWQREHLTDEALEGQLAYWRRQLGGRLPVLELPADRPRSSAQSRRGAVEPVVLGRELTEGLKGLARGEGATLFMTLLAGFKALLYCYTGQEDVVVGTGVANRNRSETEKLIGCFFNLLALRTDLSGAPGFRELLRRVREVTLGAYAHQDLPFTKLLHALQPPREPGRAPVFQVLFEFNNAPAPRAELPGLSLEALPVGSRSAKFDLTLFMRETEGGLGGVLEYSTDLFERPTVARMVETYRLLLEAAVAAPEQSVALLSPDTGAGPGELLAGFSDSIEEL
jgi:hypothetical protein